VRLKQEAQEGEGYRSATVLRRLFGLPTPESEGGHD
jgi:hypothetical protein